jgi:hypothetical protein
MRTLTALLLRRFWLAARVFRSPTQPPFITKRPSLNRLSNPLSNRRPSRHSNSAGRADSSSSKVLSLMSNGEVVTNTGAAAAIASPWWLPALHQVSEVAALVLPILGVLWLCTQIVIKLYQVKHPK